MNKNGSAAYKAVTAVFIARWVVDRAGHGDHDRSDVDDGRSRAPARRVLAVTTLIVLNGTGRPAPRRASPSWRRLIGPSMRRTAVNTISNLVGAAWIARSERRSPSDTFDPATIPDGR
jgi:hypothetical protein